MTVIKLMIVALMLTFAFHAHAQERTRVAQQICQTRCHNECSGLDGTNCQQVCTTYCN